MTEPFDARSTTSFDDEPDFEVEDDELVVGQRLSDVESEHVDWFWHARIPQGKVTVVEGDPDTGKSAVTTDWAARVSRGRPFPDGSPCEQGGVVLMNAEDGVADTIRPRLDAAGGDASKVVALVTLGTGSAERMVSIPEDLDTVRQAVASVGAKLVVIDPLTAFLSPDVNSYRDQDVRRALAPLARLAEETGVAVVVVRHLNKAIGGNPLYRGGGSIGIVAASRSALVVARHPEDEDLRVLAPQKNNLGRPAPSLAFGFGEDENGVVRVEYRGETPHAAQDLLAEPTDHEERRQTVALRAAVVGLLDSEAVGGSWEGTPQELFDLLADGDLAAMPDRPDELTKLLRKIVRPGSAFGVSRGWRQRDGKSRRVLRLQLHRPRTPPNGVDGVVGVDGVDANNTNNANNADPGIGNGVVAGRMAGGVR